MIRRFRKKPVEIEARQFASEDDGQSIAAWIRGYHGDDSAFWFADGPEGARLVIHTLEGSMHASPGDWIIRGVQGEFYPCKPDIFEQTYDEVHLATAAPEDRRGPSSLFAPRVHALAAAILASPRVVDGGWIEVLPTLGLGATVKLTLTAHLDDEELRGCDL